MHDYPTRNIIAAAKRVGCTELEINDALNGNLLCQIQAGIKWIEEARKIILSFPPEGNAEKIALEIYEKLVLKKLKHEQ